MKVLAINTYAGSLLQAATNLGCDITMSLEDKGFAQGIARANFPDVTHAEKLSQWPEHQDLTNTVVLAHPPCSAFSIQNSVASARGLNSSAFECTKRVLDYSMSNKALAIAVESVTGALPGAWSEHQRYADENGYHLYRILQNGCMFGCQWRERFWAVFVRKGAAHRSFQLTLTPRFQTVSQVIAGFEDGPSAGNQDMLLARQKAKLIDQAGCTQDEMRHLFNPPPHHPTKALGTVLYDYKFKKPGDGPEARIEVFEKYVGTFTSGTLVYLDPDGLAPVLMGGSFWYVNGRCASETAFKRIMGYPADYLFPVERRNYRTQMRMFLSKGVMPPVAEWILEQLTLHLGWAEQRRSSRSDDLPAYRLVIEPNLIADFRIKKSDWYQRHLGMPPLRTDEEGILKSVILPPRSALEHPMITSVDVAGGCETVASEGEPAPDDPDLLLEEELVPIEHLELAEDRMVLAEDRSQEERERVTRERYADQRLKHNQPVRSGPHYSAKDDPPAVTILERIARFFRRARAETAPPPVFKAKAEKMRIVHKKTPKVSIANVELSTREPLKITTRRLRGRTLEIMPGTVLDPGAADLITQRRSAVLQVVQKRRSASFDAIVNALKDTPELGSVCEATRLDYVRDMVRAGMLREVRE